MDMYDRLNSLLAEKRITKRKLSIDLGMPYSTLASMFQRRSMSVDIETVKKIASYLDTTLEFLITGNESYKNVNLAPANSITIITANGETTRYNLTNDELQAIKTILDKVRG